MPKPINQGCSERYTKEIHALRRLESSLELDPNVSLSRQKPVKIKIRALCDELVALISEANEAGTAERLDKSVFRRTMPGDGNKQVASK